MVPAQRGRERVRGTEKEHLAGKGAQPLESISQNRDRSRVAETPRCGPDVWVEEKPVFLRKPGRRMLGPAREMLRAHLDSGNLLWPQALQWLVNYQHNLRWISSKGQYSQSRPCTKKSVLLEAPVELARVLSTQRPQTQLWRGAMETHYPFSLVPPNPQCQAAICTPTSAHRGCQGRVVGTGSGHAHICTRSLNRCCLRSAQCSWHRDKC